VTSQERIKNVFLDTNFYYNVEQVQIDLFIDAVHRITSAKPVMIELGVGHSPTYSQAFHAFFQGQCLNICTDILQRQIASCKKVFPQAVYHHGYTGMPVHYSEDLPEASEPLTSLQLSAIMACNNIERIDMLHMDIQGSEPYVLQEIMHNKLYTSIDNMFISIHNTFDECKQLIDSCNIYKCTYAHPTCGGYGDGLIVAEHV